VVATAQGRASEALQLLAAATAADPGYGEAWNNLGVLQRDVGAIPAALASYERSLALAPNSTNAGGDGRVCVERGVSSGFDGCPQQWVRQLCQAAALHVSCTIS
jgi:tetratricopeptide (TPR) repeat protein